MNGLSVEIDHDDARLATVGIGNLGPVDDRQIRADRVLTEIIELGSVKELLERPSWMIGTSVAPYRKTKGGVMFGGMYFKTTSALLANWAIARVTSAPSWR
jgi:hypothetical protein